MADLDNLYTALCLEIAAVARYVDHRERTEDPTFFALLEGLMRNEEGHEEEIIRNITRMGGDPDEASKLPGPDLPWIVMDGEQFKGQKTNLAMLRADLIFEAEATRIYHEFAGQAVDQDAKQLFKDLARAERGHVNGLKCVIQAVENGTHEVRFFCPVCGWELDFGVLPEVGTETKCRMCAVVFSLDERNGDFITKRL
jgi:rubrerythrin